MNAAAPTTQRRELGNLLRSVVKVMCVSDAPDYEQPWQSHGPTTSTGSGAIIDTQRGLRVLTNAHCVANHVFVELRRYGKSSKFEAEVEVMGHECDLALLKVDDEDFFAGTTPIPLGTLPRLRDRVSVCGYPIGGERLSITEGIVSRIELVAYAQSNRELLGVQIDAAINAGNSGGPVIKRGALVGVAFQALDDADSVGYMIAPPVVEHFLEDVDNLVYDGFPDIGVSTQALESRAQRKSLGLPQTQRGGVLVTQISHGGSAWGVLEIGDVILAIDNVPLASDGTVVLREGEAIHYRYVVTRRHVGDRVPVTVWRQGHEVTCMLELMPPSILVEEDRFDVRPSYYIYGGLLFVPLTRDYLKTWGDSWWNAAPRDLVHLYEAGIVSHDRQQVVVMQKVLADRANAGYHGFENIVVTSVDGMPIRSLAHLVELVETNHRPYVVFGGSEGQQLVLERREVRERHDTIMRKFGVPRHCSADLLRNFGGPDAGAAAQ